MKKLASLLTDLCPPMELTLGLDLGLEFGLGLGLGLGLE